MEIQRVSSDIGRMQRYGPAPARVKAAAPSAPAAIAAVAIQNAYITVPEVKVPKAEEIKKLIQSNGYPYKSDVYKAVSRILEHDLN